jgi:hypothetical protein
MRPNSAKRRPLHETLNQLFNFVFSAAGDEVLSKLLCGLWRFPRGPFESIGREIGLRYAWRDNFRWCFTMFRERYAEPPRTFKAVI